MGLLNTTITKILEPADLDYDRNKKINRNLPGGGGYSTLGWVRMCGPKFDHHPITKSY